MMENPYRGRVVISQEYDSMTIEIPAQRNWFVIIFMALWLGGWAVGEFSALGMLFSSGTPLAANLFIVFWLTGWTLGGGFAFSVVFWMLAGKEIIRVESGVLTITRAVLRIGRKKTYDMNDIRNLRLIPGREITVPGRAEKMSIPGKHGNMAFDYGMKTVRFGAGIDEAEAKMIFDRLRHGSFLRSDNFAPEENTY